LIAIADNPRALLRELAEATGITERTVQATIADLDAADYLTRERTGRRNRYTINPEAPLRHSGSGTRQVGPMLEFACPRTWRRGGRALMKERGAKQVRRHRSCSPTL
jgi:DNA-binding transcriptional regulator PaaX